MANADNPGRVCDIPAPDAENGQFAAVFRWGSWSREGREWRFLLKPFRHSAERSILRASMASTDRRARQ